jgi:hypothetical protein
VISFPLKAMCDSNNVWFAGAAKQAAPQRTVAPGGSLLEFFPSGKITVRQSRSDYRRQVTYLEA